MLSTAEAAKILGVTRKTVTRWCQRAVFDPNAGPVRHVVIDTTGSRMRFKLREEEVQRVHEARNVEISRDD